MGGAVCDTNSNGYGTSMIKIDTPLSGVFIIRNDRLQDNRGWFVRSFCSQQFREWGLNTEWPQMNVSYNAKKHTFRGFHFQKDPHGEIKFIRCTRGSVLDVIVDLRPDSPSYCQSFSVKLSEQVEQALYVPTGCAHGFMSLEDDSELFYLMGSNFIPEAARGFHWQEPTLNITWPTETPIISDKDQNLPELSVLQAELEANHA